MTSRRLRDVARPLLVITLALLSNAGLLSGANTLESPFERVFTRFNAAEAPAYRAFRRLDAGVPGSRHYGWLEAWTEYLPGRGLRVEVVREAGSEYVRNSVLRQVLRGEQQLLDAGKPLRASLENENYLFEDDGAVMGGLQRIKLKAARRVEGIVNGSLFVEPDSGDVVRIEGRLVKSPSFWVRDIDVTWRYARHGDFIVPVEMTSSGRVRFYGRSQFRMVYDYESIEGRPVAGALKAALREER